MSAFSISVSERPPVRLYGMSITADMANAHQQCSHLWEKLFMPRCHEISGKASTEYQGPSYGVSIMLDLQRFTYWASMPANKQQPCPEGMEELTLAGGLYAGGMVSSMEQLGAFYQYMYTEWAQKQADYALNMQGACFEYYDERYCTSGEFEVYVAVVKK